MADDKRDRYLAHIVNETDQMNALIMDMPELSKFEVKAIQLTLKNVSMTNLIKHVVSSLSHQLENKNLHYKINKEEKIFINVDARRIEQVVLNLLSNAIRHAEENSVVTISIERTSTKKVVIIFENTGPAIAEDDLSRLWDQFYRVEHSWDRKSGGTGLGLAIVKHILELHDSEFGVEVPTKALHFLLP